jgi:WD40 repeat protein
VWNIPLKRAEKLFLVAKILILITYCRILEGHRLPVKQLMFSERGEHLYSCSLDGTVIVWDWKKGKAVSGAVKHDSPISAIDQSCVQSTKIACGLIDGSVSIWDLINFGIADEIAADAEQ